jgi:1-pyrroline-5-carboxylate dehydrogenase
MLNGIARIPDPVNEPVLNYAPGSPERASLKARLDSMLREAPEIPLIIGGREVRTGKVTEIVCPHDHRHVLGIYHQAGPAEVEAAVIAAGEAWKEWSEMPWEARPVEERLPGRDRLGGRADRLLALQPVLPSAALPGPAPLRARDLGHGRVPRS